MDGGCRQNNSVLLVDLFESSDYRGRAMLVPLLHFLLLFLTRKEDIMTNVTLTDGNITIRNAALSDIDTLCTWWADGKVMAHAGFPNGIVTDREKLTSRIEDSSHADMRLILMYDSTDIGEMNYRFTEGAYEIGIKICDFTFQEKGVGSRAIKLLLSHLFLTLDAEKVILDTNLHNKRAQHVYEKIGFSPLFATLPTDDVTDDYITETKGISKFIDQLGNRQIGLEYEFLRENYIKMYR